MIHHCIKNFTPKFAKPAIIVLSALIFAPNTRAEIRSADELIGYLKQHPRDFSLVCYTADSRGMPDTRDPILLHRPAERMPLASVYKVALLASYANEVDAGRLDPEQRISIRDWERNYLPGFDGDAHRAALEELGIETDSYGFARTPERKVTLDQIIHAMIAHSDNAAPDWLLEHIKSQRIRETMHEVGLRVEDQPLFNAGFELAIQNHTTGTLTAARLRKLAQLSDAQFAQQVRLAHDAYLNPVWRAAEYEWLLDGNSNQDPVLMSRVYDQLAPQGTAIEHAILMGRVAALHLRNPRVAQIMKDHLEWVMALPGAKEIFSSWGNKGGSFGDSVQNGTNFYVPRLGDYAGKIRVTVLFIHRLSPEAFDDLRTYGADEILSARLATERSLVEQLAALLRECPPSE